MVRNFLYTAAVIAATCLSFNKTEAQYFYKDVWNSKQLNEEMNLLKQQKIRTISIKSFEENVAPSEGFFCEEKIDRNYIMSQTLTRSDVTSESLLSSYFNTRGFIIKTIDSTSSSLNITQYTYNNSDQITLVKTFTKAYDDPNIIEENHQYFYNEKNVLEKMTRSKNGAEISTVNFKTDEKGNVTEENEVFTNHKGTEYFYYYDEKDNLTDAVHYNERAKRLLPDYMYEYNEAGQIVQMITTEEGGAYNTWRYTYNDKKLRESEKCFSKDKTLLGRVEYSYK